MKKIGLVSLGCDKNRVDSELILGLLHKDGYDISPTIKDSDIIIVNTCGFITSAKKESIDTILEVISYNKPVIVVGCLVERYLEELKKEIPEVSLWIPIRDYYRFNELLAAIEPDITTFDGISYKNRMLTTGRYFAYLRIGEGCSNHCSYCAIPLIRGEYRSREVDDIINEANRLAKTGVKELVVLEQDTTKYGIDLGGNIDIVYLLKELLKIDSFESIRLLYLYPDEISDELIYLIRDNPKIMPYFDIPIQHSENHILKDMNRRGSKEEYLSLFKKIRKEIPHSVIRTTIMVGFPGENDTDISNLLDFIEEVSFDHLGAFKYSSEEGTKSASFPNQIKEEIKESRYDLLMRRQQHISYRNNKNRIGQIMDAFVIGEEKGYYLIRTYWNASDDIDGKIYLSSNNHYELGDKIKVKITDAFVYDLYAEDVD